MAQDLLGVEIFRTGTFKPSSGGTMVITGEHLDEMVASFGALVPIGGFTPVLKLGHTDAQRFMGQKNGAPNLGIVAKIRRVRDLILADFTNVPDAVIALIRQKRFRNVSVEVVPEMEFEGTTFKNVLIAVALLGAELPAVKGLAELATTLFTDAEIIPIEAPNTETYTWEQHMYSQEQLDALNEYRRYAVTPGGLSPLAVPGMAGGMSLVTGNEHDEWGKVSTNPTDRIAMMDKRARKIEAVKDSLPLGLRFGHDTSPIGILGIGMESGVIREAVERLSAAGILLAGLQPRTIWPVPADTLEFIASKERVYVVEHNHVAQLVS